MNKKDPLKSNMIYICVFIFLTLSSSRDFSLGLNETFTLKLKFDIPEYTPTTFGNLLIQIIYWAIQVGPRILTPLYKSLVSIISNITPYVKDLTKESSECILGLVKKFANINFLKESENNCKILANVLEAINYVLLYHDDGNEEFLVTLIKYWEVFSFIETVKLNNEETEAKAEPIESLEEEKKEDLVNIEINTSRHHHDSEFLSKEWEDKWKASLNLPNIT